ncbi:hypothetical protein WJX82_002367 [Trebouxia sp. C0006]
MYQHDRVFGANINAHNTRWEGASQATQAYPENGLGAMEKAVRCTILSVECGCPQYRIEYILIGDRCPILLVPAEP